MNGLERVLCWRQGSDADHPNHILIPGSQHARRGWLPSREQLLVSLGWFVPKGPSPSPSASPITSGDFFVLTESSEHPGRAGLLRVIFCGRVLAACNGFSTLLHAGGLSGERTRRHGGARPGCAGTGMGTCATATTAA